MHKLEQILQIEHQFATPRFRSYRLILSASTPDPNNHKIESEYNLNVSCRGIRGGREYTPVTVSLLAVVVLGRVLGLCGAQNVSDRCCIFVKSLNESLHWLETRTGHLVGCCR